MIKNILQAMLKKQPYLFVFHVLAWFVLLLFPLIALPKLTSLLENDHPQLIIYVSSGLASICFYYLNYYFIVPQYLFRRKYVLFTVFCIVLLVASVVITRLIISMDVANSNIIRQSPPKLFGNYLLRFLLTFFVAFVLRFYQKMKQIDAEQTGAELERLKAQINPHFLFNTLNGIYGLALTNSDKTAEYISKLSSIMRYALSETDTEKVALENEIKYLDNYIALQKIRLTATTTIDFRVTGKIDGQQIPPLLFINFIENAFKFGVSNEVETEIKIHLGVDENGLTLFVKNEKISQGPSWTSHEMGLKNIKRRLDVIFGSNYVLEIEDSEKTFQVNLTLKQL